MDASPASKVVRDFVAIHRPATNQVVAALRVLVVDNDRRLAASITRELNILRPEDEVKLVSHGLEAMVVAEEFQPDLVIIQLGLPRRSGLCTARLLRNRPWSAHVVIVSHTLDEQALEDSSNDFDFHFFGGLDTPLLMRMLLNLQRRRLSKRRPLMTPGSTSRSLV